MEPINLEPGSSVAFDEWRSCLWICQRDGSLHSLNAPGGVIDTKSPTEHPSVGSDVVDIAVNEQHLVAILADSNLVAADPNNAAAIIATSRADVVDPTQITLIRSSSSTVAVLSATGKAVYLTDLNDMTSWTITVNAISGIVSKDTGTYVASNDGADSRGRTSILRGVATQALLGDLPRIDRLGLTFDKEKLIAIHTKINCLSIVNLSDASYATYGPLLRDETLFDAVGLPSSRLAIVTERSIRVIRSVDDIPRHPFIEPPLPIFFGSWARIYFSSGGHQIRADAIGFTVVDGSTAGFVSHAQEHGEGDPVPLLVAGGALGAHELRMQDATGLDLASAVFEVTDKWHSLDEGPPGFHLADSALGSSEHSLSSSEPTDFRGPPRVGAWRLLVVMADTVTARWPSQMSASIDEDKAAIFAHIVGPGGNGSAKRYYEENSNFRPPHDGDHGHGLTIAVVQERVFGPVSLDDAWDRCFQLQGTKWMTDGVLMDRITRKGIEDGIFGLDDVAGANVVVVVPCSPDNTPSRDARFVWPHARHSRQRFIGSDVSDPSHHAEFAETWVPLNFDVMDGRPMYVTLSHELGHTLGLEDLYEDPYDVFSADVKSRIVRNWDLMARSSVVMSQFTIPNKRRMGWVTRSEIEFVDFSSPRSIDQSFLIHASELGPTPDSRCKAVEARLADGWSYFVEYRAKQPELISDQINPSQSIVITDAVRDKFLAPVTRPTILFARPDPQNDGPLLGTGKIYDEVNIATQLHSKIEVQEMLDDHAKVRVLYGNQGRVDLMIRPWSGAQSDWKSPDIVVENDKSDKDGAYRNVPWVGHVNRIIAKVRNRGDIDAKDVAVSFAVMEHTLGGDRPPAVLGIDRHDVPGGGAPVEFTTEWVPPRDVSRSSHYCVTATIQFYQDADNPLIVDTTFENNEARSNFMTLYTGSKSPAYRTGTEVQAVNPFARDAVVAVDVQKTNQYHRVFSSHRYLRVPAKSSRPVRVWDESIVGTPEAQGKQFDQSLLYKIPNRVSIVGYAEKPYPSDCLSPVLTGGVGLHVWARRATAIRIRGVSRADVRGSVIFEDNQEAVTDSGGQLMIELIPSIASDRPEGAGEVTFAVPLPSDGEFGVKFGAHVSGQLRLQAVVVHFLGGTIAGPCEQKQDLPA